MKEIFLNQKVIDALPDELVVLDAKDRTIVMSNRTFNEHYGIRKPEDAVGRACHTAFLGTKRPCRDCTFRKTMCGHIGRTMQSHVVKGVKRHYHITTAPIKDSRGRVSHILHIARDVTKERMAELSLKKSEEQYRKLVQQAPIGILTIDKEGRLIGKNQSAGRILGREEHALLETARPLLRKSLKRTSSSEYRSESGKYLRFKASPLYEASLVLVEDITKSKQYESELKQASDDLLMLLKTSNSLQLTLDIEGTAKLAIDAFRGLGYDRIRLYLMADGMLCGLVSNHISAEAFRKITIPITQEYPKEYRAVKRKKPVIMDDSEGKLRDVLGKQGVRQSASLPLISAEKVIGLISLDNKSSRKPILRSDLNKLTVFANQIAVALENALLFKENQDRLNMLTALYDISTSLAGVLDVEKVLNQIVIKIVKLLKVDACGAFLHDERGGLALRTAYDSAGTSPMQLVGSIVESVSDSSMKERRQMHITDMWQDARVADCRGMQSMLSIPLMMENNPVGVINVYSRRQRSFSDEELVLLQSLSNQAAITIENTRLYETIRNDKDNLTALLEISQRINAALDRKRLLEIVTESAVQLTGADYGLLSITENDELHVQLQHGLTPDQAKAISIKVGEGLMGHAAKLGKTIIVGDVSTDSRYIPFYQGIRSIAAIPLTVQQSVTGVLMLESKKADNFRRWRKSLTILTNQVATAITNANLYQEIHSFNERLKQEVDDATKELRTKNIELKKMDRLKSDFVSNVSHELRTPLTSITGYTKLMLMQKLGRVNSKQRQSLKIISEESERLTRLINNVLDLSKLESGKVTYRYEKIDLVEIAKETIASMEQMASEKKIRCELLAGQSLVFKASNDLVRQVFVNLLGNAIKFTPPGGQVTVSVFQEDGFAELSIQDTGPGIDPKELPHLFNKFYQVDSSMTREHGGTGLGLVIVKHIVDALHGSVEVKSEIGKGSEFIARLPMKR
jgi:signal transduction histidine kinase